MRPDIVPGAVFPDYELSDLRGKHRTLSELQGADPLSSAYGTNRPREFPEGFLWDLASRGGHHDPNQCDRATQRAGS